MKAAGLRLPQQPSDVNAGMGLLLINGLGTQPTQQQAPMPSPSVRTLPTPHHHSSAYANIDAPARGNAPVDQQSPRSASSVTDGGEPDLGKWLW